MRQSSDLWAFEYSDIGDEVDGETLGEEHLSKYFWHISRLQLAGIPLGDYLIHMKKIIVFFELL